MENLLSPAMQEILDEVDILSCEAAMEYELMCATQEVDFRLTDADLVALSAHKNGPLALSHITLLPHGTSAKTYQKGLGLMK